MRFPARYTRTLTVQPLVWTSDGLMVATDTRVIRGAVSHAQADVALGQYGMTDSGRAMVVVSTADATNLHPQDRVWLDKTPDDTPNGEYVISDVVLGTEFSKIFLQKQSGLDGAAYYQMQ